MRMLAIALLLVVLTGPTSSATADPAVIPQRYFMSTFRLAADNQLLLAQSANGAIWTSSGNLYTDNRGLRDPSIVFIRGYYYAAYTIRPFSQPMSNTLVGIARSPDLINWTHFTDVSYAAAGNVQVVWAPEWFIDTDGSIHLLASPAISNFTGAHSFGHDIYEVHPISSDLLQWSAAAHLTGLPTPTSNPNDGNIDPFVIKKARTYYFSPGRISSIRSVCIGRKTCSDRMWQRNPLTPIGQTLDRAKKGTPWRK